MLDVRRRSMSSAVAAMKMEALEERQLLSLVVANPLPDMVGDLHTPPPATVDLGQVFGDTQSAVEIDVYLGYSAVDGSPIPLGTIDVLLYNTQTRLTVANFLQYVNNGLYNNTFIHRSVPGFIIQGGGYDIDTLDHITEYDPVQNEPGISNVRGTIAMAKLGSDPNSATSEWFINLADNSGNLDVQNSGFTVFGYVIGNGMNVVDSIAALQVYDMSSYGGAFSAVPGQVNSDNYLDVPTVNASEIPVFSATGTSWTTLSPVVGSSNPGLVTGSISNGVLTLDYAPGASGKSTITVSTTDMLGNTIDDSFTVTVGVAVNNAVSTSATPVLTGTVASDMTGLQVTVGGTTYTQAAGDVVVNGTDWSLQLPSLLDGKYDVSVAATDAGSNVETVTGQLIVDTAFPTVAFDAAQLPVVVNTAHTLTGTFDDANIGTVVLNLTDAQNNVFHFGAVLDTSIGTWTATAAIAGLADGAYSVSVTATDLAGNAATADGGTLTVDTTADVTVNRRLSKVNTPTLTGTVGSDVTALSVTVSGATYTLADGTVTLAGTDWSLDLPALSDGNYVVSATATDVLGNVDTVQGQLLIDTTAPVVAVNRLVTADTTPALSGTIDDNGAAVVVTVNGAPYDAVNNGDGTWSLPDNTVAALAGGVYDVSVSATDAMGNVGSTAGAGKLTVVSTQTIVLGAGVSKVTYIDADGTTVTVSAGKGDVALSLTGVNLVMAGTGKARTITATSGVLEADVNVVQNSASLTFKTNAKGDKLTAINQITGNGLLGSLSAAGVDLLGGIDMTGAIKALTLHNVESDIVMGAYAKGVAISANVISQSTIRTANIASLTAGILEGSTIQATTLKALKAALGYANTNVTAGTVGSVALCNVEVDNGGVGFGLDVTTLSSLKVRQGKTTLTWVKPGGKSRASTFTGGIRDFFVNLV